MSTDLRSALWAKGPRADIWAIVDTARDPKAYWTLVNSHLNYSCLFAGHLPGALEQAAPYLVQLDSEDVYTDHLATQLGNSFGIFFQYDGAMKAVRHHLRKLLTVRDPSGRKLLFRYYDPRVLRVFLPTCDSTELNQVYGPIKTYWTEGDEPNSLIEFRQGRKGLETSRLKISAARATFGSDEDEQLPAAILPTSPYFLLQKGRPAPVRLPIVLQSAGLGGKLWRRGTSLRLYRAPSLGEPLSFVDSAIDLQISSLNPDLTLYAEMSEPGTETLSLDLPKAGQAEGSITAVELTLETGSADQFRQGVYVSTSPSHRTRIVVHPPHPPSYKGNLLLRTAPSGPVLDLFEEAYGGEPVSLKDGFEFPAPSAPRSFWLAAPGPSAKLGDGLLQLSAVGLEGVGDWTVFTAVAFGAITTDTAADQDLAVLTGSRPLTFQVSITPAGVPIEWSVVRRADDSAATIAVSPNALPTLTASTLETNAAGSFEIVVQTASDPAWGGPRQARELTFVHASIRQHDSACQGRFVRCAAEAATKRIVLTSTREGHLPTHDAPVALHAEVLLLGGGPDGRRGVAAISGAWRTQVISDNSGARYKGGVTAPAPVQPPSALLGLTTASDDSPEPFGTVLSLTAGATPGVAFDATLESRPIEQIWCYLDCRSSLVLFAAATPDSLGSLLEFSWSFTGDYACAAGRVRNPMIAAKLASTGVVTHAKLVPVDAE